MKQDIFPRNNVIRVDNPNLLIGEAPVKYRVEEIYLDGKLKKAEDVDEEEKSYGIFMHSLVLSNYAEVMNVNHRRMDIIQDEKEKAIFYYTEEKGFDKSLIESIVPKVEAFTLKENKLKVSTHIINEKMRIISRGTPDELMRRCSYILLDSKFVKKTRKIYKEVNKVLNDMINRCCTVYALAIKDISKTNIITNVDAYVNGMTLVALIGMCPA
ncbi:hypothetical protein [Acetivibrio straminisolvens]|jgi:magnesium-transporting ATPase (P-type)|uniref:Calcium-translocating P-type ATPase n=1 Tax=Acetivibrio straminisolvens JCM 21531 TaxID=1294263 RepID=W4V5L3_9FIRM|nr:hypothetical protein [Acetivibrio straminisolvens]GAE88442.1 calcium-translocating P-type ATPase [Acetivibrio straminisolvens JCM 21531]